MLKIQKAKDSLRKSAQALIPATSPRKKIPRMSYESEQPQAVKNVDISNFVRQLRTAINSYNIRIMKQTAQMKPLIDKLQLSLRGLETVGNSPLDSKVINDVAELIRVLNEFTTDEQNDSNKFDNRIIQSIETVLNHIGNFANAVPKPAATANPAPAPVPAAPATRPGAGSGLGRGVGQFFRNVTDLPGNIGRGFLDGWRNPSTASGTNSTLTAYAGSSYAALTKMTD